MRIVSVLGAGSILSALVCSPLAAQKPGTTLVARGDTAPGFTLKNLAGDSVSLADFPGHPVLIDFWGSWCPPCKEETPRIVAAWTAHHDSGFVVLAVNGRDQETSMRQVRSFVKEFAMPFPVLLDEKGNVRKLYGLLGLPTLVFIGANGVVSAVETGPVPPAVFQRDLEEILSLP
jgi:peroxiredoxin